MPLRNKLIVALGILLLGAGTGYGIRGYICKTERLAAQVVEQAADLSTKNDYLAQIAERDRQIKVLNQTLTDLDADKTRNLNHALETNDALRNDLTAARRMRLTGTTCPRQPAGDSTASTSSVGDGAGIELSSETRRAVFDLRASIISDSAKLDYLQAYLRQTGLSPPAQL